MTTADRTRRRALAAAAALAVALAVTACGDDTRLLELRVGDCVSDLRESIDNPDGAANGVPAVEPVPCTEPHDAEVLRISPLPDGEWPGSSIVNGEAARGQQALQERVTSPAAGSGLSLYTFKPTEQRWNFENQHEIVYVVLYSQPRRGALPS